MTNFFSRPQQKPVVARIAVATALAGALVAAPLQAQTTNLTGVMVSEQIADGGASQRITLAGNLRMLNERIVSAACYFAAGMEPVSSRATLTETVARFDQIAAALEFGDPALGIIEAEERPRTLARFAALSEVWPPMAALAAKVEAGDGSVDDIAAMASQSVAVRDIVDGLIVQISSQYSTQTTVLQSDVLRLDIAGRQETLSQQIAKTGCLISRGINPDQSAAELATAAEIFDTSMTALRQGRQDVGIEPPPTDEIAASLDEVAKNWSFMKRVVSGLTAGQMSDDITLGVMFLMSNQVTDNMAKAVSLYQEASRLDG
ncbi:type IV pili methyl-accepting chemotaxis transducer N-terminal domain-containing protein [Yoonia sp.]|uniref:type IV pili methyl-accepting chemotaxis transducer N-terminal domain-containing protein n=1 Tax=Yoonia sp. TaxID=2212373 RepID=UPI002FD98A92